MAASLRDDAARARDDADRLGRDTRRTAENGREALPGLARQAGDRARDRARDLLGDRVDRWRDQAEEVADVAGENLENARVYVVERVQERPLTATLAALGVGFLLGALLSGSRR